VFSTDNTKLSKEAIASRMFRNAARFWGLNDTNIDNFDPLVRLLLEACAVEVYRIDHEVASLQRSMTERLAGLLIPEVHTQPRPAHAICHARSTDEYQYVALESQFVHQKRIASVANGPLDTTMDVFFSPAGRFKVIDGDVKLLAAGGNIFRIDGAQNKETFLRCMPNRPFAAGVVWVGIEARPGIDLSDLSIYVDLANVPDRARYLSMLRHVRCECHGNAVKLSRGLSQTSFENHQLKFEDSLEELYINRRLEKQIHRIYCDQFLTITADGNDAMKDLPASWLERYPTEFESALQAQDLVQLEENLLWLKFYFPAEFTAQLTEDLSIGINCFPVVNRHINELSYRLNAYFNIIPLLSSEQFFAVKAVEGTVTGPGGRNDYIYYPFDQYNDADKGIYTVRVGDLERFDSRNAAEYLNYLVELLRDESRAFAAFGQDFMAAAIKDLNQNIGLIDQKIRQNLHLLQTSPTYLLVNPVEESDTIFVQYWTSNGSAANGIRANTPLDLYEGSAFKRNSIVLMSATSGGMDKLENTETLKAFKSVLLSRGRVVTASDVKNFCSAFLQTVASDVAVERGVRLSPMPDQGLMPVVKVSIKPGPASGPDTDWERLKMDLSAELEAASAPDVNYLIQVN
jgi:hypothetical protein